MTFQRLDRRALLRGTFNGASAAVALPLLEAMHGGTAKVLAATPVRMGIFFWAHGVRLSRWTPKTTGPDWALTEELAPLAKVKSYLNVISGHRATSNIGVPHQGGTLAVLSGYPGIRTGDIQSKFGGPTIDQVAAPIIGKGTRLPSVNLQVSKRVLPFGGVTNKFMSAKGPDQPIQSEYNPRKAFATLFGGPVSNGVPDPSNTLRMRVLDAVREDARALHARLGAADRVRLDAHLTSVDQIQKQIAALPVPTVGGCKRPVEPSETNQDANGREPFEPVARIMADLLATAFACDLTRVATYFLTQPSGETVFWMDGQSRQQHLLTHEGGEQEAVHRSVIRSMTQLAYLLERMKDTPDGDGNLLDHSVWLCATDVSEGFSHSTDDLPMIIAGRASGFLKYPGHHTRRPGANVADSVLTVLRAAGTGLLEVGKGPGASNKPCREVEA